MLSFLIQFDASRYANRLHCRYAVLGSLQARMRRFRKAKILSGYLPVFGIFFIVVANAVARPSPQGMDSSSIGNVHVRVVYPNDRAAGLHLRVRLMSGSSSTPVSENFTNDQGVAEFTRIPVGEYHVVVTGEGVEDADSGQFEIDRRKTSQDLFITVRSSESNSKQAADGSRSVAAVDLNVPASAQKEFDEASKAMAEQAWAKAVERLKRAISIYPQYAPAYNNLGVAYGRLNEPAEEREALEKAISLNDHFVPAFVNLAKMSLRARDSAKAESLLENALRADPSNPETLTLLAEAQLLNKDYDAAIASAHNVHAMPHQNFAVVHYIAARAFEHENRPQDALAEFQTFLAEEPKGARAEHVREEVAKLKNSQP
jgi:tetratricopeptide (TPR) repeat protein